MAVMIQPRLAIRNFRLFGREGAEGAYGFYESIDYTRERLQPKQQPRCGEVLHGPPSGDGVDGAGQLFAKRSDAAAFRAEPMVRAAELLLQECAAPERRWSTARRRGGRATVSA